MWESPNSRLAGHFSSLHSNPPFLGSDAKNVVSSAFHGAMCVLLSPPNFPKSVRGGRILILWSFIVVIGLISIRLSIYQLVCVSRCIYVFKSLFSTVMVSLSIGCADELCFTSTLVHKFDVVWFMFIAVCGVGRNLLLYLWNLLLNRFRKRLEPRHAVEQREAF